MIRLLPISFWALLLPCLLSGCSSTLNNPVHVDLIPQKFSCNAEQIHGNWINTSVPTVQLHGKFLIDSEIKRSGKQSIKLDKNHQHAFIIKLKNVNFLDEFKVKVWRYKKGGKGRLVIRGENGIYTTGYPTGREEGLWEEVAVTFSMDKELINQEITIQCWYPPSEKLPALLDDFSFEQIHKAIYQPFKARKSDDIIALDISKSAIIKLANKREEALKQNILITKKTDWVRAQFNDSLAAEVRLKGDWTDHLRGKKWSLRIELLNNKLWNGMEEFSIQSPATRSIMCEWVYHQMLTHEDLLTTRFFFMPVKINYNMKGIYAVEEHFTEQLLKWQQRPNGPLLKFNEDHLWDTRLINAELGALYPVLEAAEIEVYSSKKFKKDSAKYQQMVAGRNLLFAAQHNLMPASDVYDIERMGKYFALIDLMGASHSLIWHNLRFYYNPKTKRIEPIGYDANPTTGRTANHKTKYLEMFQKTNFPNNFYTNLFTDKHFCKAYLSALKEYTNPTFLDKVFQHMEPEFKTIKQLLKREFVNYSFHKNMVYERAVLIRKQLKNTNERELIAKASRDKTKRYVREKYPETPFPEISVVAYKKQQNEDEFLLQVLNFYNEDISIVAVERGSEKYTLPQPLTLTSYIRKAKPVFGVAKVPFNPKKVYYKITSSEEIYVTKAVDYPMPEVNYISKKMASN
jgi:hypothetical protein